MLISGSYRICQSLACKEILHTYIVVPTYWVRSPYVLVHEDNKTIRQTIMGAYYETSMWYTALVDM